MKVKELIEILQKYPGNMDIMIDETDEYSAFHGIDYLEQTIFYQGENIISIVPDRQESTDDS